MKTTIKDLQEASKMLQAKTTLRGDTIWKTTNGEIFFHKKTADYAQLAINKGTDNET